ncbi:MAG: hypothetical protein IJ213_06180 [Bacteroidales bacterium]|nr:hypothetical protein [Bacteroidales bacterium]
MATLTIERQQNDIIRSILNIKNPEILKDLRSYIKKKSKEKTVEDDTIMTKEEFFDMIDKTMEDYEQGCYTRVSSKEELHDFLNTL